MTELPLITIIMKPFLNLAILAMMTWSHVKVYFVKKQVNLPVKNVLFQIDCWETIAWKIKNMKYH